MAIAERTGQGSVDRYWKQLGEVPRRAHAYVSLLGLRTYDTAQLHERVQEGLSYEAFERFRHVLDVPASRLAELLRIPSRTLGRRKQSRKLDTDESDRLVRLSRMVGQAIQLFEGDMMETQAWLKAPHTALANETPLEFATTEIGAREVENLIGRLEHGVVL